MLFIGKVSVNTQPILLSGRMLHKDYDHKGSAVKKSLVVILEGLGAKIS
jgi:hypothetical protein